MTSARAVAWARHAGARSQIQTDFHCIIKKETDDFYGCAFVAPGPRCTSVMRSPRDSAIPCVLLRMRTCPLSFPSASLFFSTLTFTSASSPKTLMAYKFAACKIAHRQSRQTGIIPNEGDASANHPWLCFSFLFAICCARDFQEILACHPCLLHIYLYDSNRVIQHPSHHTTCAHCGHKTIPNAHIGRAETSSDCSGAATKMSSQTPRFNTLPESIIEEPAGD